MPEHLRALIVILVIATIVFSLIKIPACGLVFDKLDFEHRRNYWFGITLAVFIAHNFWIYIILVAALLLLASRTANNKVALYFLVLFAAPPINVDIGGLGAIRYFFTIDYLRLLSLTLLLPTFLSLKRQPEIDQFGRTLADKFLIGYILLIYLLTLHASTFPHSLRSGVFYAFLDVFLPYYVIRRSLKSMQDFKEALSSFVIAGLLLSAVGTFEYAKHWLLYAGVNDALGTTWSYGNYLERGDGTLRAQASAGHAIPLGYAIAVASGLFLYAKRSTSSIMVICFGLLLMAGLIAPLSRGPWIGAATMLVVFMATGPSPAKNFFKLGLLGAIMSPILLMSSAGDKILSYMPFVGTVGDETVTYRQRLLEITIDVILRNPVLGAYDYMYSATMQELRQGQGIIDIVNTYIGIALSSGLLGLGLFCGFFITVVVGMFKAMNKITDKNDERHHLGRALFATMIGILVTIFTVSSITIIPVVYWSVAGLCVAYTHMLAREKVSGADPIQATVKLTSVRPALAGTGIYTQHQEKSPGNSAT